MSVNEVVEVLNELKLKAEVSLMCEKKRCMNCHPNSKREIDYYKNIVLQLIKAIKFAYDR